LLDLIKLAKNINGIVNRVKNAVARLSSNAGAGYALAAA